MLILKEVKPTVLLWHFQNYDLAVPRIRIQYARGDIPGIVGLLTGESDPGGLPGTGQSAGIPRNSDNRRRFFRECRAVLGRQYFEAGLELVTCRENTSESILSTAADRGISEVWIVRPDGTEENTFLRNLEFDCRRRRKDMVFRYLPHETLINTDEIPLLKASVPDTFSRFRRIVEKKPFSDYRFSDFPWPRLSPTTPGRKRMRYWIFDVEKIASYKATRNGLGEGDYSSRFSPYLASGALSAMEIGSAVMDFESTRIRNESTYWLIFELLWRDYFHLLSIHLGPKIYTPQGMKNRHSPPLRNDLIWKFAADGSSGIYPDRLRGELDKLWERFRNWVCGTTDQPFINAMMRDLFTTGWISNRARQCAASYLIHDLRVPWWWGALWFEGRLIDYDTASNWGNWSYLAGVGADSRPSRRFDPIRQESTYDPEGNYRRSIDEAGWSVPEDSVSLELPGRFI